MLDNFCSTDEDEPEDVEEAENASWAHLPGHDGSDGVEPSGALGAPSGSMQSAHSSSDQLIRVDSGTRCITTYYSIAVSQAHASERDRTKETEAALVAEGVLKTGGDESRGVVAGGELEASA